MKMASTILKQPVLPGSPIAREEHTRMVLVLSLAVIILIAIGAFYWLRTPPQQAPTASAPAIDQQEALKQQIIAEISSNAPQSLTSEQATEMSAGLKPSKSAAVNEATKQEILEQL